MWKYHRSNLVAHSYSSTGQLAIRFFTGMSYLCLVAGLIAFTTQYSFFYALLVVVALALLAIVPAALWMQLPSDQRRQFRLNWLFLLPILPAAYLAAVRWVCVGAGLQLDALPAEAWLFALLAVIPVCVLSYPFLVFLGESLMWLAVWIVRRRSVQTWLARRRSRANR